MPISLALFQPDIPQNAGTLIRLAACLGAPLHFIHPAGFAFSDARLKRAGMDYLDGANIIEHASFSAFDSARVSSGHRLVLLTTKSENSLYACTFAPDDILMVGRESAGVPAEIAARADVALRIPMKTGLRSLNVAVAAAMSLGEALRQTGGFAESSNTSELM